MKCVMEHFICSDQIEVEVNPMWNSIKQLVRTPLKFCILLASMLISTIILNLGCSLLVTSTMQLDDLEQSYTTIATVQQKETSIENYAIWDAATNQYTNQSYHAYDQTLSIKMLENEQLTYLQKPFKRPYYGAYMPEYQTFLQEETPDYEIIIEFQPVEDCIPDHPVLINVTHVWKGNVHVNDQLWLCDHITKNPDPLKADKTYIASLIYQANQHEPKEQGSEIEWFSVQIVPRTTQYDAQGNRMIGEFESTIEDEVSWEEVNEGFYETGRGIYWMNMMKAQEMIKHTIPVLPTRSLTTLPAFHKKQAYVVEGEEISEEEFARGDLVCLISDEFAKRNQLQIGQSITLPLYFANERSPSSATFGNGAMITFSLLNHEGELYSIFFEESYIIKGFYRYENTMGPQMAGQTEMAYDQIIVPANSITASDENHIVDYGPMLHTTTSFQIPNGEIEAYEAAISHIPNRDLLEIHFDDNGYSNMKKGLDQTRITSYLLCGVGIMSMIAVICMIIYFFIIKQRKRIAIERSLGMSKHQCRRSLLGGLLIFILFISILGSMIGMVLLHQIPSTSTSYISEAYSSIKVMDAIAIEPIITKDQEILIRIICFITPILIIILMYVISRLILHKFFQQDLMILLSDL